MLTNLTFFMRKLIEVNRLTWAKVKQFATIKDCNLCEALEILLSHALNSIKEKGGE
jgi:hypothetical protein